MAGWLDQVLGAGPGTPDAAFADFLRFIQQGRRAPGMNPPGLQNARPNPPSMGPAIAAAGGNNANYPTVSAPVAGPPSPGPYPATAAVAPPSPAPVPVAAPWPDAAGMAVDMGSDISKLGPPPPPQADMGQAIAAAGGDNTPNPWANAPNPWPDNPWLGAPNPWAPTNPLNAQTMAMIGPPGSDKMPSPPTRRGAGDGGVDAREREITRQLNENETRRARGQPSKPGTAVAQGTEAEGPRRPGETGRLEEVPNGRKSKAPAKDPNAQRQMMDYDRWLFDPTYQGPGNAMRAI